MTNFSRIIRSSCLSLGAITLIGAGPINAALLEEVVVTAQKREQNLQDVSVSVTAFDGESLARMGISTIDQVFVTVPNATVTQESNAPSIAIRGIRLNDFGDGNESPVSLYIDDVYQSTLSTLTSGLFDIQRVEVLRGPQGTLFGRNSTGGLMHLVTNKPTEEFAAKFSYQRGSYDEDVVEGVISGPLSDSVRGRVAGYYKKNDGWQENITSGRDDYGSTDYQAIRAMLEVDFSDNLTGLFKVNYAEREDNIAANNSIGNLDPDAPFVPPFPGAPFVVPNKCPIDRINAGECINGISGEVQPDIGNDKFESDLPGQPLKSTSKGIQAKLTWDLGNDMELVSVTAYQEFDRFQIVDIDGSIAPRLETHWGVDDEQFTQELHLSGNTEAMNWIVGGFYLQDKKDLLFQSPQFDTTLGHSALSDLETESWAVFGQADYALNEQLSLILGLRYTDESKELFITDSFEEPNFADDESLDVSNVTWKVGAEWRPSGSENLMLYGNVTHGFKSGTFNTTLVVGGRSAPVAEETVTAFEIGMKGDFWDGLMRMSGTIFYNDYEDIQSVNSEIINGGPVNLLVNIPSADIYGLELETIVTPADYLQLIFNLGLLDTEIKSDGILVAGFDVDGNSLPGVADVSYNLIGILDFPFFPEENGALSFQARYSWQDDVNYSFTGVETTVQESFGLLDLNLRWDSPNQAYFIEGFVKNATDEEYHSGGFDITVMTNRQVGQPRWGGVKVGFSF